MQARRREQERAARAAAGLGASAAAARRAEQQARARRAAEAAAESARILREEEEEARAKAGGWRGAMLREVAEAALPARAARYEAAWAALEARLRAAAPGGGQQGAAPALAFGDVPWPLRALAALGGGGTGSCAPAAADVAAAAGGEAARAELRDLVLFGATCAVALFSKLSATACCVGQRGETGAAETWLVVGISIINTSPAHQLTHARPTHPSPPSPLFSPNENEQRSGAADVKRRLRRELLRFHPDKAGARLGPLLRGGAATREAVLAGARAVTQQLTALMGGG